MVFGERQAPGQILACDLGFLQPFIGQSLCRVLSGHHMLGGVRTHHTRRPARLPSGGRGPGWALPWPQLSPPCSGASSTASPEGDHSGSILHGPRRLPHAGPSPTASERPNSSVGSAKPSRFVSILTFSRIPLYPQHPGSDAVSAIASCLILPSALVTRSCLSLPPVQTLHPNSVSTLSSATGLMAPPADGSCCCSCWHTTSPLCTALCLPPGPAEPWRVARQGAGKLNEGYKYKRGGRAGRPRPVRTPLRGGVKLSFSSQRAPFLLTNPQSWVPRERAHTPSAV